MVSRGLDGKDGICRAGAACVDGGDFNGESSNGGRVTADPASGGIEAQAGGKPVGAEEGGFAQCQLKLGSAFREGWKGPRKK